MSVVFNFDLVIRPLLLLETTEFMSVEVHFQPRPYAG